MCRRVLTIYGLKVLEVHQSEEIDVFLAQIDIEIGKRAVYIHG